MENLDSIKLNCRWGFSLVVVSSLEIANGSSQSVCKHLLVTAINTNAQHILLVANLISELGLEWNMSNLGIHRISGLEAVYYSKVEVAGRSIVEFGDGILRDAAVDMDLANDGAMRRGVHRRRRHRRFKSVCSSIWAPTSDVAGPRIKLAELCSAVLGVRGCNAMGALGSTRHIHNHGTIITGVEIRLVLVAVASLELTVWDSIWVSLCSNR